MDLMSSNEHYEYRDLVRKYANFLTPAAQIVVDGADVTHSEKDGLAVESVRVSMALDAANTCQISLACPYDGENSSFGKKQLDRMGLGRTLSVKLGYGSAMTEVFKGYIHELGVEYSGTPRMNVTAMDLRKLMMENKRSRRFSVKDEADAVRTVLEPYRKFYDHLTVESGTPASKAYAITQDRESDYEFVMRLAKESGKEFFVLGSNVYFISRLRYPQSVITLSTQGGGIQSFSTKATYINKKFQAIGRPEGSGKELYASGSYRSSLIKKVPVAPLATVLSSPRLSTQQELTDFVSQAVQKEGQKSLTGSLSCVGLPELAPGHFLTCAGLGDPFDGQYYIEAADHSLASDGFRTELTLGGAVQKDGKKKKK